MMAKILTEHRLGFLSSKGGCRGSSESKHFKMKSHALAQLSDCFPKEKDSKGVSLLPFTDHQKLTHIFFF